MLVTFNDVTLKYVDKLILNKASFTINDNDKIGIVGINGTGKSSLLKAIIGEVEINSGTIYKKSELKISYLPQEAKFNDKDTIFETAKNITKIDKDFEINSMLSRFGLNEYDKKIENLSGGEKRRLSLAIALLTPCELLILDEPTNHLDIWMINWLEKFLTKWNKALLLVTHDRYFLERITNKTLDIELGNLYLYNANYSKYLELKAERMEYLMASNRKLQALLKKEAVWASLNPQARTTKSTERLARFKQLEETVHEGLNKVKELNKEMNFSSVTSRLGKKTILIEDLSKEINGKSLFNNFSYLVKQYDRLGIVGPNGIGKTTLFKTILGEISADFGKITIGETVRIGYLKQEDKITNSNIRIIDYIKEFGENIETKDGTLSASQFLENFMFSKTMQYQNISSLSGGEKRRLQIVALLIQNPNILFLDEPTNDLDIYTLELLEDYLESFKGAVIVISHDRYFLDKVTTHSFIYKEGELVEYTGLISDYITDSIRTVKSKEKIVEKVEKNVPRFTSQEKKEFDQIENKIYEQEELIKYLKNESYNCGVDYQKLMDIEQKLVDANNELDRLYQRYEYLNQINDAIIEYRKEKYNG